MGRPKNNKIKYEPKYKTESLTSFETRFDKLIKSLKDNNQYNDKYLFFIPISSVLTGLLETYTSHWRRDLFKSKDGLAKLQIIETFLADQERALTNELIRRRDGYKYIKLIDTYYGKRNEQEEFALDENETVKDTINIQLNGTGLFKDNGNKD